MPLRQPLVYRRRQQKTGVAVDQAEVAHARMVPNFGPAISCPRILPKPSQRGKSDGLLGAEAEWWHRCRITAINGKLTDFRRSGWFDWMVWSMHAGLLSRASSRSDLPAHDRGRGLL